MSAVLRMRAVAAQEKRRPPILLKNGKSKIRLQLRRMAFQKELDGLPSNMQKLVELLIQSRSRVNGGTYEVVTIWNRLRNYEKYWANFQFRSEAEFLAHYCLPDGLTLASWTVMVTLFDRATFVLLGEEVLLYMMRWVEQYQSSADERKKDYQIIFERYCRQCDDFNRKTFYDEIRRYTTERYEKPLAKQAGLSHEEWLKKRPKQTRGRVVLSAVAGGGSGGSNSQKKRSGRVASKQVSLRINGFAEWLQEAAGLIYEMSRTDQRLVREALENLVGNANEILRNPSGKAQTKDLERAIDKISRARSAL